ncbi:MAG TPA: insulinase family protein [Bacteriovoracaceae bacterium]|nr:insulinase family protein [Bacteriovoracaceae bacterium]
MNKLTIIVTLLLLTIGYARASFLDSVKREKWGDLEVVWIEDDKFPKFTASIYFQNGAVSDSIPGLTQATFDQLTSGTSKETEKQIAEFFDFYGANIRSSVTHEYSVMSIQALTKDMDPVVSKVCEIMQDARYPVNELKSYVSRSKSRLKNLVTNHAGLADRIFRDISLQGTNYSEPVEGTLASFDKLNSEVLKERLAELSRTKKVLYLAGSSEVKNIKKIISEKCKWSYETKLSPVAISKPSPQSSIYLIPVTGANQAQIRIGRYMNYEEMKGKHDQFYFLGAFLGGGFTSKLVQELRVKRGLTYSAGAYVSMQRDYARAGIMTFSKSETTAEAISIIRDIFNEVSDANQITDKEFKHEQGHQIGGYAFHFEETNAFLGQIMLYDHQKRDLSELATYPDRIAAMTKKDLARANMEAFPWERQTIIVVGDKSLEKSLSRIRPVKILNFEKFL